MLVIGLIGAFAVHESTETVDDLSQELGPAQVSNSEFMQSMLDAETELRAYLISGEREQLLDHRAALAKVPEAERALAAYAKQHPEMADLVAQQKRLAGEWVSDFARAAIADGPMRADDDRKLFDLGVRHLRRAQADQQPDRGPAAAAGERRAHRRPAATRPDRGD